MSKFRRPTVFELAERDPHLIRLAYWLASQLGRKELQEWDLQLEWDNVEREAIMRKMEEKYLCDEKKPMQMAPDGP